GGDPRPLLRNASGLTWIGPKDVMFSEIKAGVHMGIVVAEESRIGARDVYLPPDEPGMAHRSYPSPDRNWVLLVEMDKDHYFFPGPRGRTSALWEVAAHPRLGRRTVNGCTSRPIPVVPVTSGGSGFPTGKTANSWNLGCTGTAGMEKRCPPP